MRTLPLFHRLEGRPCLVVGGGIVAARKIRWLLEVEAQVTVVAPELCDELQRAAGAGHLQHAQRRFAATDVDDVVLVIAATNDLEVNRSAAAAAGRLNVPVNVVDNAELSTVVFPSIVDRDPLMVAISTDGESPTLARWVRMQLETLLPLALGRFAAFLGDRRRALKAEGEQPPRQFWEAIVAAGPERGEAVYERLRAGDQPTSLGQVAIVGAGPGDPELITLKTMQLLQNADLVLYDNLVNTAILDYARRDAERRYVGKKRAFKGTLQEDINRQLVDAAEGGLNVVRLKGGDPFVFGRGGEEIASLAERGIPCVVAPGITAALGAASYAGIPLTYRHVALSVRFITGHVARGSQALDWRTLAQPDQTLVFYMGLFRLADIAQELIGAGVSEHMPVALVENATLPEQRVVEGTLATISDAAMTAQVSGPTVVVVGEVVRLRTL